MKIIQIGYRSSSDLGDVVSPVLPSNWQMAKNLAQAGIDVFKNGADKRTQEEIETVLKICETSGPAGGKCPKLVDDNGKLRCGNCGCYLGGRKGQGLLGTSLGKASLKSWSCPLGKW